MDVVLLHEAGAAFVARKSLRSLMRVSESSDTSYTLPKGPGQQKMELETKKFNATASQKPGQPKGNVCSSFPSWKRPSHPLHLCKSAVHTSKNIIV